MIPEVKKDSQQPDQPKATVPDLYGIIFDGRYYIGVLPSLKNVLLSNVVEFVLNTEPTGRIVHVGCFLGELMPVSAKEHLLFRLALNSALYNGYYEVLVKSTKSEEYTLEEIKPAPQEVA
jgi:hypothetical protein